MVSSFFFFSFPEPAWPHPPSGRIAPQGCKHAWGGACKHVGGESAGRRGQPYETEKEKEERKGKKKKKKKKKGTKRNETRTNILTSVGQKRNDETPSARIF